MNGSDWAQGHQDDTPAQLQGEDWWCHVLQWALHLPRGSPVAVGGPTPTGPGFPSTTNRPQPRAQAAVHPQARPWTSSSQTSCFHSFQVCESHGKPTVQVLESGRLASTSFALLPLVVLGDMGSAPLCCMEKIRILEVIALMPLILYFRSFWYQTPDSLNQCDLGVPPRPWQRPLFILIWNLHGAWPTAILNSSPT